MFRAKHISAPFPTAGEQQTYASALVRPLYSAPQSKFLFLEVSQDTTPKQTEGRGVRGHSKTSTELFDFGRLRHHLRIVRMYVLRSSAHRSRQEHCTCAYFARTRARSGGQRTGTDPGSGSGSKPACFSRYCQKARGVSSANIRQMKGSMAHCKDGHRCRLRLASDKRSDLRPSTTAQPMTSSAMTPLIRDLLSLALANIGKWRTLRR